MSIDIVFVFKNADDIGNGKSDGCTGTGKGGKELIERLLDRVNFKLLIRNFTN